MVPFQVLTNPKTRGTEVDQNTQYRSYDWLEHNLHDLKIGFIGTGGLSIGGVAGFDHTITNYFAESQENQNAEPGCTTYDWRWVEMKHTCTLGGFDPGLSNPLQYTIAKTHFLTGHHTISHLQHCVQNVRDSITIPGWIYSISMGNTNLDSEPVLWLVFFYNLYSGGEWKQCMRNDMYNADIKYESRHLRLSSIIHWGLGLGLCE